MQIDLPQSVTAWLATGERGTSSETIVEWLYGIPLTGKWRMSHPHDPADLRRCLKLLAASPETAVRFHEMQAASPEWSRLVECWNELERIFLEEAGVNGLDGEWWSAPRTYAAMKSAIYGSQGNAGAGKE